MVIYSFLSSLI
jgi:hypothetical protein